MEATSENNYGICFNSALQVQQTHKSLMFEKLPDTILEKIVKFSLMDPLSKVGESCKALQILSQDLTSLSQALARRKLGIIKRIISIISATDPGHFQARITSILNKVCIDAKNNNNFLFLKQVLELPQFYGKKINLENEPELNAFTTWAAANRHLNIQELIVDLKVNTGSKAYKFLAEEYCNRNDIDGLKNLLKDETIPKNLIVNPTNLAILIRKGNPEIFELLFSHLAADLQIDDMNKTALMDFVVLQGRVDLINVFKKYSVGNLSSSIRRNTANLAKEAKQNPQLLQMLKLALTSDDNGVVLIPSNRLNDIIQRAMTDKNEKVVELVSEVLLQRNAKMITVR